MKSLAIRAREEERMDDPALPAAIYAEVMRDLARVNRVTMARRPTLGFLDRALAGHRRFRLLDVGFGDGDMLRAIARWAKRRNLDAELIGIDLNPSSAPAAAAHTPPDMRIEWRTGDYADLAGARLDLVISSLVAHHMSHAQLIAFLRFMEAEAATGWFVNDLHRHRLSYASFPLLARLMGWHEIVRSDGTLSIARSYRPGEWPPILAEAGLPPDAARVFRAFPFRLCVERRR